MLEGLDFVDEGIGLKSEAKSMDGAMAGCCFRRLTKSERLQSLIRRYLKAKIFAVVGVLVCFLVEEVGLIWQKFWAIRNADRASPLRSFSAAEWVLIAAPVSNRDTTPFIG